MIDLNGNLSDDCLITDRGRGMRLETVSRQINMIKAKEQTTQLSADDTNELRGMHANFERIYETPF